jgi:hypothetical protein
VPHTVSPIKKILRFIDDPETYVPQYGGYCAYGVSEGHKSPTEIDTWTINDKLYFNYNSNVKKKWEVDVSVVLRLLMKTGRRLRIKNSLYETRVLDLVTENHTGNCHGSDVVL